jgi:hypothetical protein
MKLGKKQNVEPLRPKTLPDEHGDLVTRSQLADALGCSGEALGYHARRGRGPQPYLVAGSSAWHYELSECVEHWPQLGEVE